MTDANVNFSASGLPETVLPDPPADASAALATAVAGGDRAAVADVAARWPRLLEAWATLGELAAADPSAAAAESYAYFRVGYHRGLDALRAAGWRGSGFVRSAHPSNRGFLRSLDGLRAAAARIGETDEADRCAQFLQQLNP
jgi:hypothetical protein